MIIKADNIQFTIASPHYQSKLPVHFATLFPAAQLHNQMPDKTKTAHCFTGLHVGLSSVISVHGTATQLQVFRRVRKTAKSDFRLRHVSPVGPSVLTGQLRCHWTELYEI